MAPAFPIRVGSIPAGHPYIAHLGDPGDVLVLRPPDPAPAVADPLPGQWWPPALLEPDWVTAHHHDIDLMHLHFGFEASTPDRLRQWVDQLERHRRPLVLTVHDLANPHFADQREHLARLDVLVPRAAEVITLTRAAAAEIARRWQRRATVIPHPHVVPLDRIARPSPPHPAGPLIGVHAKDLRANLDPLPVLRQIADALPRLPGARLRVDVHPRVLGAADHRSRALADWLRGVGDRRDIEVATHDRFTDDELYDYLQSLDLCVLPYSFGTHSGWLEACVDLGTAAIVPATGYYADQHGHPAYRFPTDPAPASRQPADQNPAEHPPAEQNPADHPPADQNPAGLADTPPAPTLAEILPEVTADLGRARPPRPDRAAQRSRIGADHLEVYRRALREFSARMG